MPLDRSRGSYHAWGLCSHSYFPELYLHGGWTELGVGPFCAEQDSIHKRASVGGLSAVVHPRGHPRSVRPGLRAAGRVQSSEHGVGSFYVRVADGQAHSTYSSRDM